MAKGVFRVAKEDDPIFTGRFTVSSKKADMSRSIGQDLLKDHESHLGLKNRKTKSECEDESQ